MVAGRGKSSPCVLDVLSGGEDAKTLLRPKWEAGGGAEGARERAAYKSGGGVGSTVMETFKGR